MSAQRLGDGLALQLYLLLEFDVLRRCTNLDDKCARFDVPFAHITLMGIESKLLDIESGGNGLGLSGLQRDAGKALQLDRTDILTSARGRQIDLGDFVSLYLTRILHLEGDFYKVVGGLCLAVHLQVLILKRGVAQTIAEGPCYACILLCAIIVADRLIDFRVRIADGELG